jgi:hypothetical protein
LFYLFLTTQIRFRLAAARRPRPGQFRPPGLKGQERKIEEKNKHVHDPDAPDALVLYRPSKFDKLRIFSLLTITIPFTFF